jgi:thiol-disulfide isomerase/thioredoxin
MVILSTELTSRKEFAELISHNPGIIIVKLGATWCGPCQRIEPTVKHFFENSPANCLCVTIDIDKSIDIYAVLKRNRIINGVPGLLCYTTEEDNIYPSFVCNTGDINEVNKFFQNCMNEMMQNN